ncbi:MAG: hypothetical protein LQ352_000520 [Teloschistes flavicans]|nr:MAG: hypothetical protein LQ352_000520 [Teloschistes flavicans]
MASVTSLGNDKPSALTYLVDEGILRSEPAKGSFSWHTSSSTSGGGGHVEEELITTDYSVVWSRGGVLQRVFRFDADKEKVKQAVFAHFQSRPISVPGQNDPAKPNGASHVSHSEASADGLEKTEAAEIPSTDHIDDRKLPVGLGSVTFPPNEDRAIVVILQTLAHIFFLEGTSHIVHLPFEVEAVFPLPIGILLQRQASLSPGSLDLSQQTESLPVAPPNSFAFSQQSFGLSYGSKAHGAASTSGDDGDEDTPISLLVKKEVERAIKSNSSNLPRLFSLTDPLSQLGTVGLRRVRDGIKYTQQHRTSDYGGPDSLEDLLYVSSHDELARSTSAVPPAEPLMLAMTHDRHANTVTIWHVTKVNQAHGKALKAQTASVAKAATSRRRSRRSSFGPASGTGATTPIIQGVAARDSPGLGQMKVRTAEEQAPSGQDGLSFQLNTALEGPSNPARTSRRVSSLLARADLSTTHDHAAFSELVGGHRASQYARRCASFGSDAAPSSLMVDDRSNMSRSRARKSFRASIESLSFDEHENDNFMDDMDDLSAFHALDIGESTRGLRQEYALAELYTTSLTAQKSNPSEGQVKLSKPTVHALRPPNSSLGHDGRHEAIYICVHDRTTRTLLSFRIHASMLSNSHVKITHCTLVATDFQKAFLYEPQIASVTRLGGVMDACKVSDRNCARLVVLSESSDGIGQLSLRAPWSARYDIILPARLNVYNPTGITTGVSPRQSREGGFKRVVSLGSKTLSALQHRDSHGHISIVDSEDICHRVKVQLRPRNPLVDKMIQTCEAVMSPDEQQEMILCAWWTIVRWLRSRSEVENDEEWTAMLVVLLSIPAGSIQNWHSEATSRQKRRKAGLLRSSSGANTDLESWETMLSQEAGHMGSLPLWMQDMAWHWVTDHILPSTAKQSSERSSGNVRRLMSSTTSSIPTPKKSAYMLHCSTLAREVARLSCDTQNRQPLLPFLALQDPAERGTMTATILIALHLLREEMKLDTAAAQAVQSLTPVLAQLGGWLGWEDWGFKSSVYYVVEDTGMENWLFDESIMAERGAMANQLLKPPSIFLHIEKMYSGADVQPFLTLDKLLHSPPGPAKQAQASSALNGRLQKLTPRTIAITQSSMNTLDKQVDFSIDHMISSGIDSSLLETLPESVAAPFRSAVFGSQASPSPNWNQEIMRMIGRGDLCTLEEADIPGRRILKPTSIGSNHALRDVHTICTSAGEVESVGAYDGSAEADRQSLTRMLFKDDQRFAEAARLLHPLTAPTAQCLPETNWSDTELLEAQQELVKIVATRTLSVSLGRSLLFYCARYPLVTEKFPIHGFTLSCVMKPSSTTITADRSAYTEEKVSWAFFHAGVEAGLSISKDAKGINSSWILYNKPHELKNRHAGLLFALGLNGHLNYFAKWMYFQYLTPKHTMTSIGLLLGLAVSHLGTADVNVTKVLSIHLPRLLPPGSAELHISPLVHTSSIMGIGLLYCHSQHRRMSEIMLSEMENTDYEENSTPAENSRDEGYRLAAGFALGYINLGGGKDLRGLHDMQIVERLLILAVGTKRAELVHILDKATAAATVAVALIFLKTGNAALARKIDVPDTIHQFDYVRPDILLLRTVARHLIMWDEIRPSAKWMQEQLPRAFRNRRRLDANSVNSHELPYMNILAGLCLSLGLRYAGTGQMDVRNLLCHQLDQFIWMCRLPSNDYDRRLTRITTRNCQDTVALAAACVMAGTGDLQVFRRLRALHGRTDAETPYGSHLAAHLAIGILFVGGGTHSFGTSNVAVASLLCAFYPLFPTSVLDNQSHLQAFRHFWVLAAEPRCLVIRDLDTQRPLSLPLTVKLRNGLSMPMTSPCLLPELGKITELTTGAGIYWPVTVNLAEDSSRVSAFRRHQIVYVRRLPPGDAYGSVFNATMLALDDAQSASQHGEQLFSWIFTLPVFEGLDRTERAYILPPDLANVMHNASRETAIDDSLILRTGCVESGRSERLWNLRLLFAWADALSARSGRWGWLREDVVMRLRAKLYLKLGAEQEG